MAISVLRTATLAAAALLSQVQGAYAQTVSVTINGAPLNLNPAPQERAGRIFVPLRGIFQGLGASVVYASGEINAQGGGNAVSLHIGSTQATVNGQPQTLDVAPFVIGASTYVPLRFVSQALGARVNYDGANHIVAIVGGANSPASAAAPNGSRLRVVRLHPERDANALSRRPTIDAQFEGTQADPNSLRISLDELDITGQTSRSPSGFVFSPPSDLQSMRHVVRITGNDASGAPFEARWSFSSGTSSAVDTLAVFGPPDGATVGSQFTVRGRSTPGAVVVVQAGTTADDANGVSGAIGSILGLSGGSSVRNEVTTGADGTFATAIVINAPRGSRLALVVTSTDPQTKAAATPIKRFLTVR